MNNYKDTFLKKLTFVIRMVTYFGAYNVPKDWWDVSVVRDENVKTPAKGQIHEARTVFIMKRLDNMYKPEYERVLMTCNIKVTEDKEGIYYKSLNYDPSKNSLIIQSVAN